MTVNRRAFLALSAAGLATPRLALASPFVLRAAPVTAQILPDGDGTTEMFGYNDMTPGPELRFRQGDTVDIRFENAIGEGSAVHWHGIRIDNAMDGVPYLTQTMVEDGEAFDYHFTVPDAGTYWYHSHNRSWEQVARGLYGPLIVEETAPPEVDHDITVILDDWRIERTGEMIENFGNRHDFSHAGRLGTYARAISSVSKVQRNDRVRLRFINAATARVFPLELAGLDGKVVALDGMPLAAPRDIERSFIAPAQRMDVIADVTDTVQFIFPTQAEPYPLGEIEVSGENPTTERPTIAALPSAKVPAAGAPDRELTLQMQGGAMGRAHGGDDIWSFNGISGMEDKPWAQIEKGTAVKIKLINDTAFPHGIHLHGHHFYELEEDGTPGAYRDTSLLQRQEERDILCVFDNPGKWLIHCHMLGHQASGMKTWIEVV